MKKIIQTLITFSILFFGINGVKAVIVEEVILDDYVDGTCELQSEASHECNYSCKIEKDSDYLTFDYNISFNSGKLKGIVENKNIKEGLSFFGCEKESWHSLTCTSKHWGVVIEKDPPLSSFFDKNDNFSCPTISIKDNVKVTQQKEAGNVGAAGTSISGIVMGTTTINHLNFSAQKNDISEDLDDYNAACGLLGEETSGTVIFLKKAYQYLKVLLPILIITLGIVDFVKVVVTGKDDDMKKAVKRLTTRIVVAVVFVLVPVIIQILINISGLTGEYSGINDGIKAMLCILG